MLSTFTRETVTRGPCEILSRANGGQGSFTSPTPLAGILKGRRHGQSLWTATLEAPAGRLSHVHGRRMVSILPSVRQQERTVHTHTAGRRNRKRKMTRCFSAEWRVWIFLLPFFFFFLPHGGKKMFQKACLLPY